MSKVCFQTITVLKKKTRRAVVYGKGAVLANFGDGGIDLQQQQPISAIAYGDGVVTVVTPSTKTFEPMLPDSNSLIGFGLVVILSAVAVCVWANEVVPVSRTNLALNKRSGPLRDYLDELGTLSSSLSFKEEEEDDTTTTTAIEYYEMPNTTLLQNVPGNITTTMPAAAATTTMTAVKGRVIEPSSIIANNRDFERWFFADWLTKPRLGRKVAGRQKEPALPVLKQAKWNSGDNPVLAATALILVGVFLSAIVDHVVAVPQQLQSTFDL